MPIYSLPSLRQPESISPQFYFTSQPFIARAQADIDSLLAAWQDAVRALPTHHHHPLPYYHPQSQPSSAQKKLGPFLKFKAIYARLGWIYIHLAVVDPALRRHCFNTLARLLLASLAPQTEPLRQIGSLFALWALWGTQPDAVLGPKLFIIIDPGTSHYLDRSPPPSPSSSTDTSKTPSTRPSPRPSPSSNTNPSPPSIAPISTPTSSAAPPTIKPSDSVFQVLKNLRDQHAFLIQPAETALTLPQTAQLLAATRAELARWEKAGPLCDPAQLNQLRNSYLATKSFLPHHHHHQQQQSSSSSSPSSPAAAKPDPLARELFAQAIGMTRKVIQKTGPGLDHLLFPNDPRSATAPAEPSSSTEDNAGKKDGHSSLDAFFLVDQAQSIPQLEQLLNTRP
ncbi:hypothetical protein PTTG_26198 [Puccinia triticina 1-1 BBBD Race 1]|uniref:Uncharacterized protein n=1 Tax=Puccinia triticina (isolate 1-1 / race 1 (BBBD)) TaxID=630390 RepID=A0A180GWQ9_PUCT1|nr:hypothetical protein PTTG_26198 [Puccinia triticina 1-1 BBBD Race 1]